MQLSLDVGQGNYYFKAAYPGCANNPKSLDLACCDDPKSNQFKPPAKLCFAAVTGCCWKLTSHLTNPPLKLKAEMCRAC